MLDLPLQALYLPPKDFFFLLEVAVNHLNDWLASLVAMLRGVVMSREYTTLI